MTRCSLSLELSLSPRYFLSPLGSGLSLSQTSLCLSCGAPAVDLCLSSASFGLDLSSAFPLLQLKNFLIDCFGIRHDMAQSLLVARVGSCLVYDALALLFLRLRHSLALSLSRSLFALCTRLSLVLPRFLFLSHASKAAVSLSSPCLLSAALCLLSAFSPPLSAFPLLSLCLLSAFSLPSLCLLSAFSPIYNAYRR